MGLLTGSKNTTTTDVVVDVHSDPTINVGVDIGSLSAAYEKTGQGLQSTLKTGTSNLAIAFLLGLGLVGLAVSRG